MTAIVGILNKKAAVMAADSALTVQRGDNTRIYNNATKIFKLSDKQPVGAMIFSSFMLGIVKNSGAVIVRLLQKSLVFL